ncbi:CoA transferase [Mycobacterium sp. URHB0021]
MQAITAFSDHTDDALSLSGLRVLDNTHSIAAPVAPWIAAEHGAKCLHLSVPSHAEPTAMSIDTSIDERAPLCDLADPAQASTFWRVLVSADAYLNSYLNLDARGFGPLALAPHRPGLVVLDYQRWGTTGPWSAGGRFDQRDCATIEFSADEGSYHIQIDLAKVQVWVEELGLYADRQAAILRLPNRAKAHAAPAPLRSAFSQVTSVPAIFTCSMLRPRLTRAAEPLGASALASSPATIDNVGPWSA